MVSDQTSPESHSMLRTYRVDHISPTDVALVLSIVEIVGYALFVIILLVLGTEVRAVTLVTYGIAVWFGAFLGGLILAIVYNVVAGLHGGVRVGLVLQSEVADTSAVRPDSQPFDPMAPSPPTTQRKTCPSCDARIRADRSFCPECDHSFD